MDPSDWQNSPTLSWFFMVNSGVNIQSYILQCWSSSVVEMEYQKFLKATGNDIIFRLPVELCGNQKQIPWKLRPRTFNQGLCIPNDSWKTGYKRDTWHMEHPSIHNWQRVQETKWGKPIYSALYPDHDSSFSHELKLNHSHQRFLCTRSTTCF